MTNDKYENQMQDEMDADIITLEFDNGEDVECEIMGVFDYEGEEYIALIPDNGTDDTWLYGYAEYEYKNDDGEIERVMEINDIEDEALFNAVAREFQEIVDNLEDEEAEEE